MNPEIQVKKMTVSMEVSAYGIVKLNKFCAPEYSISTAQLATEKIICIYAYIKKYCKILHVHQNTVQLIGE